VPQVLIAGVLPATANNTWPDCLLFADSFSLMIDRRSSIFVAPVRSAALIRVFTARVPYRLEYSRGAESIQRVNRIVILSMPCHCNKCSRITNLMFATFYQIVIANIGAVDILNKVYIVKFHVIVIVVLVFCYVTTSLVNEDEYNISFRQSKSYISY